MKKPLINVSSKKRKVVIILFAILLTVIIYFMMWGDNSFISFGKIVPKNERVLADGIWGDLGLYKNPEQNLITFVLLGVAAVSILVKVYTRFIRKPKNIAGKLRG